MIEVKNKVKYYRYSTLNSSQIASLDPTSILVVGLSRVESSDDPISSTNSPSFLYKLTPLQVPLRLSNHTFTLTQVNFPHLFPTQTSHLSSFFITSEPFLLAHPAFIQSFDCSNTHCMFIYSLIGTGTYPSFIHFFFHHSFIHPPPRPSIPPSSLLFPLPPFILTVFATLIFPH